MPSTTAAIAPRLNTRAAARKLKKSVHTLARWRQRGVGPAYFTDGREVFYVDSDLDDFATARVSRHNKTSEYTWGARKQPLTTQP
jgi:hypothetical protein